MQFRTSVLLSLMVSFLSVGSIANAAYVASIRAEGEATGTVTKYRWNAKLKAYEVYEMETNLKSVITGIKDKQTTTERKETRVPGVHYKGFARIYITERKGVITLTQVGSVNDTIDGIRIKGGSKASGEVVLVKGTMEDFKKGESIELTPTHAGRLVFASQAAKDFGAMLKLGIQEGMKGTGLKIASVVTSAEISPEIRFEVSPEEIIVRNPSIRYVSNLNITK